MRSETVPNTSNEIQSRAQGCMLGQLTGDALGSLVEFQTPSQIKRAYPRGVNHIKNGGTWNTIAGQPTDDSEMALLLARLLVKEGKYNPIKAKEEYIYWLNSGPFDCGNTISSALSGRLNQESQANGAMMRVSPLGIFGANYSYKDVYKWAVQDAEITHPNKVCLQANALYAMAISFAIKQAVLPNQVYFQVLEWANELNIEESLFDVIDRAGTEPPKDYVSQQGWVLIAFHNALYQLVYSRDFEKAVVDTVMQGGDTDTNAAICGALMGACFGIESIPEQWKNCVINCRPDRENPDVNRPRPRCFWPVDAIELADSLLVYK